MANRDTGGMKMCTARCKKQGCGRRCHKDQNHKWMHRCLRHGNFI